MNEHHNPQERHQSHAFGRQIFENSVSYITTRRWSHGVCAVSTLRQRGLAFDVWRVAPVPIEEPDFKLTFIGVPLKLKICVPDGHRTLCPLTLSRPTSIRSCWVIAGLETGQQPGWRWLRCRMEARSSASQRNWRVFHEWVTVGRDSPYSTRCCCHTASSSVPWQHVSDNCHNKGCAFSVYTLLMHCELLSPRR